MARWNCSVNPPKPGDPPPRRVIESNDEETARGYARAVLGDVGFIMIRNPDPDVQLHKMEDGTVQIRELDKNTGWLGGWRKLG